MTPTALALMCCKERWSLAYAIYCQRFVLVSQLLELLYRPAPLSRTICQSLVRALLDGINSHFGRVFDDTSAVHPKFKL